MNFLRFFLITAMALAASGSALAQNALHQQFFINSVSYSDYAAGPFHTITIRHSGSYRLESDLVPPVGHLTAIRVKADNVTIDLNGFSIIGPGHCPRDGSTYTIECNNTSIEVDGIDARGAKGLVVRNGRIKGFDKGINASGDAMVEDLMLIGNRYGLFRMEDGNAGTTQVMRTQFSGNESALCVLSGGAAVTDTVFSRNGTAVLCGTEPTSFSNSYFVGNGVGFGIWVSPYGQWKGPSGPYGLSTVFMRDNKQNSVPPVAFY